MATGKKKTSVDLIIFDLDGTLIDSKKDISDCVNYTLEHFGENPLPMGVIAPHVGKGIQPLLREVFENRGASQVQKVLAVFNDIYAAHLTDTTRLYPGVLEVLEHYRAKEKVVLTNKMQIFAETIVRGLKLSPYFSAVYGREAFSAQKPDPKPILEICGKLKIPLAGSVMVGDTDVDMIAGKGAGVVTVAALYGYGEKPSLHALKPDFFIQSPVELVGIFE